MVFTNWTRQVKIHELSHVCLLKTSGLRPIPHLLFFTQKKLAFCMFSGIITTNLGKTATHTKVAGREKTDTSLQNMPFSLTGEGHFFCM